MADPVRMPINILSISNIGVNLVASTTKYLSTLPHPIDTIEELVAVISVISNLLTMLHSNISRFPSSSQPSSALPFISPLSTDVLTAFSLFARKMREARDLKVFEPNDVGLVRMPKFAWAFVMGGETEMNRLRSRLYVEKYRVRVLIDAVAWRSLRELGSSRTEEQESEWKRLRPMLPLVAERMLGVWKDYGTRLQGQDSSSKTQRKFVIEAREKPVIRIKAEKPGDDDEEESESEEELGDQDDGIAAIAPHEQDGSKINTLRSTRTSFSTSSTLTATKFDSVENDPIVYERWVLRHHAATRTITSTTTFLCLPLMKTQSHMPSHHYMKPLSSHSSEIQELLSYQLASGSSVQKEILSMPETAQDEIQRLLERRQQAASNNFVNRTFEVVAMRAQPRRNIAQPIKAKKWRCFTKKREPVYDTVEWVLLIKGQTVDRKPRVTPVKEADPWKSKEEVAGPRKVSEQSHQRQQQHITPAEVSSRSNHNCNGIMPGTHVLRHVEQRRFITVEEAERRMDVMYGKLFEDAEVKGETRKTEDDREDGIDSEIKAEKNPFE